jgi:DNA-binding transcriptional LysR family regulator
MALDPEAMLIFAALARAGGVRGAAAALGIPRSTVSRRLAELEKSAGGALVVRTARRFTLTELGGALVPECEKLEELLRASDDIVRGASREPAGTLRIACAPVIGEEVLPAILAELAKRHPRLTIDARLAVDYVDLRKSGVDVAVRAGAIDDASDLYATRLGTSVTGCWASASYLEARGVPETPADLASHACIVVRGASGASGGAAATWTLGRDQQVDVSGPVRTDSFRLACDLAAMGVGIVKTARMLADPLVASGALVPVLERYWIKVPLHAVHAGPNPAPPKVRAFIELARAAVSRSLEAVLRER